MNLLSRSCLPLLAAALAVSCASLPPPASRAPNNPANPAATEAPIQKLDLFGPAETLPEVEKGAAPDTAMPEMDHSKMGHSMPEPTPAPEASAETYTCVMHPHIAEPKPGICPICGMTLVKKPGETK